MTLLAVGWLYYTIIGVVTAGLIGLLIFMMKNRKEEDE
jgi:hypothetical protein